VIHYLTVGHLDPEALRGCAAVATSPLDETTVRSVLAEFPGIMAEYKDGYVVLPWHGLGPVDVSEAFALRLYELTGWLIADRRNGRLIEPGALSRKVRVEVQELTRADQRIWLPRLLRRGSRNSCRAVTFRPGRRDPIATYPEPEFCNCRDNSAKLAKTRENLIKVVKRLLAQSRGKKSSIILPPPI
jgi:hypothetical protein